MEKTQIPEELNDFPVHFVGIKGTGMAALAELFAGRGAMVIGSDTEERFYTDEVLKKLNIPFYEGFSKENLSAETKLVVHSAAYDRKEHPELLEAHRRGIPILEYTEALGALSRTAFAVGIAGVHGKTTTAAMAGTVCKELELPVYALVGSAVKGFGNRSTYVGGNRFFIAETCEYRRHFLSFSPDAVLVSTVDADHLDYFRDGEDVMEAFLEYGELVPQRGTAMYCADDEGAVELIGRLKKRRPDIIDVPYGFKARGDYSIREYRQESGCHVFRLGSHSQEFHVRIPGRHSVLNAAAAVAVADLITGIVNHDKRSLAPRGPVARALEAFEGSKRRSEIIGEHAGILFADDYGHHPTELRGTIQGFRDFYPDRRLIVDFMSHTYSRTEVFLRDFAESFSAADEVILHKIYASAREKSEREGRIDGKTLYEEVKKRHPNVRYFHEPADAREYLYTHLRAGDLFLTMGAGDNWRLAEEAADYFSAEEHP